MTQEFDLNQLIHYLAGECSPAEARAVDAWLAQDAANLKKLNEVQAIWGSVGELPVKVDINAAFRSLEGRTHVAPVEHGRRIMLSIYKIFPATVALIVLGVIGFKYISRMNIHAPAQTKIVATSSGQRVKITLADGSTLLIGPKSQVRYSADFGKSTRDIYLEGEALFTVTHDGSAPFIVHAGGAETRVLGTSFTVRKYASDTSVRVVVAQGKVAVGNTVLVTGDEAHASAGVIAVRHRVDVATKLGWTTGALVFNETLLRDVIPDLERWYNLQFHVADTHLLNATVTTSLDTESVDEMLSLISGAVRARVVRNGTVVTLTPE